MTTLMWWIQQFYDIDGIEATRNWNTETSSMFSALCNRLTFKEYVYVTKFFKEEV